MNDLAREDVESGKLYVVMYGWYISYTMKSWADNIMKIVDLYLPLCPEKERNNTRM